jgi:TPR repeat protein
MKSISRSRPGLRLLALVFLGWPSVARAQFARPEGFGPLFPKPSPAVRLLSPESVETRADAGDPDACLESARRLADHRDTPERRERFRLRLLGAAEKGSAEAWNLLGLHYMNQWTDGDRGLVTSPELAAEAFGQAAAKGHVESRFLLGMLQLLGHGGGDAQKGEASIRMAAEAGHLPACRQMAAHFAYPFRLADGDRPADPAEARKWFLRTAKDGDPLAQYGLACLLLHGPPAVRNPDEGRRWLERARVAGHLPAADLTRFPIPDGDLFATDPLLRLHGMLRFAPRGLGFRPESAQTRWVGWVDDFLNRRIEGPLPKEDGPRKSLEESIGEFVAKAGAGDPARLRLWRETIASLRTGKRDPSSEVVAILSSGQVDRAIDDPEVARSAAELLWSGAPDLPAAPTAALEWWIHAARLGDAPSLLRIGRLWMGETADRPDPAEGLQWIEAAARLGDADACREMARCLTEGIGRPIHRIDGLAWLIAVGIPETDPARAALQARLAERDIAEARTLAKGRIQRPGKPTAPRN